MTDNYNYQKILLNSDGSLKLSTLNIFMVGLIVSFISLYVGNLQNDNSLVVLGRSINIFSTLSISFMYIIGIYNGIKYGSSNTSSNSVFASAILIFIVNIVISHIDNISIGKVFILNNGLLLSYVAYTSNIIYILLFFTYIFRLFFSEKKEHTENISYNNLKEILNKLNEKIDFQNTENKKNFQNIKEEFDKNSNISIYDEIIHDKIKSSLLDANVSEYINKILTKQFNDGLVKKQEENLNKLINEFNQIKSRLNQD